MPKQKAGAMARMIIAFGVAAILILWSSFAAFLALSRETQLDAAGRGSAAMALAIEQHAEMVFAAADSALATVIAEIDDLAGEQRADAGRIRALLERNMVRHKYLVSLVVVDAAGRLQHDMRFETMPPIDFSDRDYFVAQRDNPQIGLYIGAPVQSRISGRMIIPLSRSLQGASGRFQGIVVAAVPVDTLAAFLHTLQLRSHGAAGILRPDGMVLVREPDIGAIGRSLAGNTTFRQDFRSRPVGTLRIVSEFDRVDRLYSYRALPNMPVFTYSAVSIGDALADWRRLLRSMSAIALFCTASIVLLTALLVRQARRRELAERQARRRELQLEEARKLETVGRLAGGIAHDFNNILGAILGFAGFLQQDLAPDSPEHRFAARIATAGKRGKELVEQVLAFSRLNKLERRPTDLVAIVRETREMTAATLPDATRLICLEDRRPLVANVNGGQVARILCNLLTNARDALSDRPGTISVEVARITGGGDLAPFETAAAAPGLLAIGRLQPAGHYARITITDDGGGMVEEQLRRAFEPFFTTKSKGNGTGLGLAIVHGTILAYDGACLVSSRPGAGTSVAVYLPLVEEEPAPATAQPAAIAGSGGGERILVIDDEPMITESLAIGLGRLGYRVTEMNHPAEALALFGEDPSAWDLVICDQSMPSMTGSELFRQIRSLAPSQRFVLCTGYSDGLTEEALRALGIDAYFHKPVEMEELAAAIRRLLAQDVAALALSA